MGTGGGDVEKPVGHPSLLAGIDVAAFTLGLFTPWPGGASACGGGQPRRAFFRIVEAKGSFLSELCLASSRSSLYTR